MHLILTGATGLVGSGVLDAMIKAKDVTRISILSRRPVPMADAAKDPRIRVIQHSDFAAYPPSVLDELRGANGCVWALGISQTQVNAEDYVKITKTYALAAAEAFAALPPEGEPFRFVYVSGDGATFTPGRLTPIFGRVKGETELALAEMRKANPLLRADTARPGMVDPVGHEAILPFIPPYSALKRAAAAVLLPAVRATLRGRMTPTEPLGGFLTDMAMGKWDARLAGDAKVVKIGEFAVVENGDIRRYMGLDK